MDVLKELFSSVFGLIMVIPAMIAIIVWMLFIVVCFIAFPVLFPVLLFFILYGFVKLLEWGIV